MRLLYSATFCVLYLVSSQAHHQVPIMTSARLGRQLHNQRPCCLWGRLIYHRGRLRNGTPQGANQQARLRGLPFDDEHSVPRLSRAGSTYHRSTQLLAAGASSE